MKNDSLFPLETLQNASVINHTSLSLPYSLCSLNDAPEEPARKKTQLVDSRAVGVTGIRSTTHAHNGARREKSWSGSQIGGYPVLLEEGLPFSIQIVIQTLLECGEANRPDSAYDSLDEVIEDLIRPISAHKEETVRPNFITE